MKPIKFTLKDYERNEDINNHSLNALMLVKKYGTKGELKEMQSIVDRHELRGYLTGEDNNRRFKLSNKYYKLLKTI
jgi:hypothetical protein